MIRQDLASLGRSVTADYDGLMHEVDLKTGCFVQQVGPSKSSTLAIGEWKHYPLGCGKVMDNTYDYLLNATNYALVSSSLE